MKSNALPSTEAFIESQSRLLAQYEVEATSHYLSLKELPLNTHILEAGEGDPVLLLHGGGGLAVYWAPLAKLLQEQFNLFMPDYPGYGLSDKLNYRGISFRDYAVTFIKSLMDELQLEKASFVANSMGGFWSIAFALAYPERVGKLVLIGAPAGIDKWTPPFLRLLGTRRINTFLYATVAKPSIKGTRDVFRRILVANVDRLPDSFFETAYLGDVLPGAQESFLTMLEEVSTLRGWNPKYYIREELAKLKQPTLFIWGDKDAFAPPSSGEEMCKVMPEARIEVIKNAGHLPWLDEPEQCAKLIIDFLKLR